MSVREQTSPQCVHNTTHMYATRTYFFIHPSQWKIRVIFVDHGYLVADDQAYMHVKVVFELPESLLLSSKRRLMNEPTYRPFNFYRGGGAGALPSTLKLFLLASFPSPTWSLVFIFSDDPHPPPPPSLVQKVMKTNLF